MAWTCEKMRRSSPTRPKQGDVAARQWLADDALATPHAACWRRKPSPCDRPKLTHLLVVKFGEHDAFSAHDLCRHGRQAKTSTELQQLLVRNRDAARGKLVG